MVASMDVLELIGGVVAGMDGKAGLIAFSLFVGACILIIAALFLLS